MKSKLTKVITAIAIMLTATLPSVAHDFEVDGIYYNITSSTENTVEVTHRGTFTSEYSGEYKGDIIIPDEVVYNNTTYKVTGIGSSAFYDNRDNDNITSITVGNNVTYISKYAFNDCSALSYVSIGDAVETIGDYAFQACVNLTSLSIGKSVNYFGENVFYGVSKLSSVVWNVENSPNLGGTPFNYAPTSITSFSFGNTVKHIPANLCNGLSGLTSITIPKSVESIGYLAFNGCNLSKIYARPTLPPSISANTFTSTTFENATLYIYENSATQYMNNEYWQNFYNTSILAGGTVIAPVYLTIQLPEGGIITHKEDYNEAVDLSIVADEGWKTNTITFNDEDVTAELDSDGNYTTPILTADAIISIVFEKIDDDMSEIEITSIANDVKVYSNNSVVTVVNAKDGALINIYDINGKIIYSGTEHSIPLSSNDVYILTVENKTFKFAI